MKLQNKQIKDAKLLRKLWECGAVFTAFDTETTGVSSNNDRVIEIGAVKFSSEGVIETFQTLVNPRVCISPFITNLTHITNDMIEDAPVPAKVIPEFLDFVKGTILVAHNAGFDVSFINAESDRLGYGHLENSVLDTVKFSRMYWKDEPSHRLPHMAEVLGVDPGQSHRAFDDAKVCVEIVKAVVALPR